MAPRTKNTRSRYSQPTTSPVSIDPPRAEETPKAPTKPQPRRPKTSVTKTRVTNPRRSARIALLSDPPAAKDASYNTPAKEEEEPAGHGTINCAKPAAGSGLLESDEREDEERSESDLSELSDGLFERKTVARVELAEKPLKEQLATVTAERDDALARLLVGGRPARKTRSYGR